MLFMVSPVHAQPDSDQPAAEAILSLLNQWRLEQGLLPLKPNLTLDALALYQARYVISQREIPDGAQIHIGRNGEGVKERARYDEFDWPYYGSPDRIAVEEIAAVNSAAHAIEFWKGSTVHRNTVQNPAYREIGIAALPHSFGYLYIVVVGSRPDVLPALVNSATGRLHLGNEYFEYAGNGSIGQVTQYRLFDAEGRPITDAWMAWTPTIDIPADVGESLFVLYTDGSTEVLTPVHLSQDGIVLAGSAAPPTEMPEPSPTTNANPPSETPRSSETVPEAPTPTAALVEPQTADLHILYDDNALTILNVRGRPLNLTTLVLSSPTITLPFSYWAERVEIPASSFPANDCVQVWSNTAGTPPPESPPACVNLRSQRGNLTPDQRFWRDEAFTVSYGGIIVTTCAAGAQTCTVDLP